MHCRIVKYGHILPFVAFTMSTAVGLARLDKPHVNMDSPSIRLMNPHEPSSRGRAPRDTSTQDGPRGSVCRTTHEAGPCGALAGSMQTDVAVEVRTIVTSSHVVLLQRPCQANDACSCVRLPQGRCGVADTVSTHVGLPSSTSTCLRTVQPCHGMHVWLGRRCCVMSMCDYLPTWFIKLADGALVPSRIGVEHEKLQVLVRSRRRAPCEAIERILHGLVERCGWEEGRIDGDHLLSVKVPGATCSRSFCGLPCAGSRPEALPFELPSASERVIHRAIQRRRYRDGVLPSHSNAVKFWGTGCGSWQGLPVTGKVVLLPVPLALSYAEQMLACRVRTGASPWKPGVSWSWLERRTRTCTKLRQRCGAIWMRQARSGHRRLAAVAPAGKRRRVQQRHDQWSEPRRRATQALRFVSQTLSSRPTPVV